MKTRTSRGWRILMAALLATAFVACGSEPGDEGGGGDGEPGIPIPGQDSFLSAGSAAGEESGDGITGDSEDDVADGVDDDAALTEASEGDRGERSVEEGDIYRVLSDDRLLNLNYWRGLQIIDISNVEDPQIIGRHRISGTPVELYAMGDRVIILMNNWRGYWGSLTSLMLERVQGGIIAVVDISEPTRPQLISQSHIPGNIQRSRLVREGDQAALYVAAQQYDWRTEGGLRTWIKSFDVSGDQIIDRDELELGGWVNAIQATPTRLMVARGTDSWWRSGEGSIVKLIDISDPSGRMVEGEEVRVRGAVHNQFNMDVYNDVLRVVSGNRWGSGQGNWIQTWNASDINDLQLVDEETFGAPDEDLYATLFMGNRAFFVTYFLVDPFHAFEITDEGIATERNEFVVSGWNDFFRPVHGQTRLVGIGMNDEGNTQRAAVSLYDITDLDNTEPMLARAEVSSASWTWSEANWDHRAFSVLENAVSVMTDGGVEETGLVLLPFSGWDNNDYQSAVQIFTFSDTTITERGTLAHTDPVRRTFLSKPDIATNFSETEMRFHDLSDPDAPEELSTLELAPNFADVWILDDVGARLRQPTQYWWYYRSNPTLPLTVEFFDPTLDPDVAPTLGSLEFDRRAQIVRAGDELVALMPEFNNNGQQRRLEIAVIDHRDPSAPALRSALRSSTLPSLHQHHYYDEDVYTEVDFGYWGGWYGPSTRVHATSEGLFIIESQPQSRSLGMHRYCSWYPSQRPCRNDAYPTESTGWTESVDPTPPYSTDYGETDGMGDWGGGGDAGDPTDPDEFHAQQAKSNICEVGAGGHSCDITPQGHETCRTYNLRICMGSNRWSYDRDTCRSITPEELSDYPNSFNENCYEYETHRYWQSWTVHRVDLRNPDALVELDPVALDTDFEARHADVLDDALHVMWAIPVERQNDPRPWERWFFQELDLSADGAATPPINVPGRLIQREGNTLVTRDSVYGANVVETTLNRLTLEPTRAVLNGLQRFEDQWVNEIRLDGAGNVLVSHREMEFYDYDEVYHDGYYDDYDEPEPTPTATPDRAMDGDTGESTRYFQRLSIFALDGERFRPLSETVVDNYGSLAEAAPGRAIFQVGQGLLVIDTSNASAPIARAWFATQGWPRSFATQGDELWYASGRHGIQKIDATETNLLER